VSRNFVVFLILVSCVLIATWMAIQHNHIQPDPLTSQLQNVETATKHLPIVKSILSKDKRFSDIDVCATTADNGSVRVFGSIASENDLDALIRVVASTSPPVYVSFGVKVRLPAKE
jgi:hypothetical protein